MKIEQIKNQPIGRRLNPGTLSIKTYKKTWQVGEVWWSQVILMDETGEMPADVDVGKTYNPIRGRGNRIIIISAEVQEAEYLGKNRRKLVVSHYSMPTTSMAEYEEKQGQMDDELKFIIQGKIRHGLVCACISPSSPTGIVVLADGDKERINDLVDFIMTGE